MAAPLSQRGGLAIGVPFGQQFGGLGRNSVSVPESSANSNASPVRPPIHGQNVGMVGSLGSSSQMRPGGVSVHHQQRPVQSSLRPPSTSNNQSPATQNFQGHGLLRVSSIGAPSSASPNTTQNQQSHTQPWLSSASQGKPPLPSPSFRPQSQSLQHRSHTAQHHNPFSPHQPINTTQQTQQLQSQPHDHHGQQFPPTRVPQPLSNQQHPQQQPSTRIQALGSQKPGSDPVVQPSTLQLGPNSNRPANVDTSESCDRILSKRSIHDLVTQIDPSERLDPEVEDILVDIADDFVESITTFGCSLAKHRKSTTLEAKDIILHLERNWNMTLPGFGGDEIKVYQKKFVNDIHSERLAAIKKSIIGTEMAGTRSSVGQGAGNAKSHQAKAPTNTMSSPNPKV